MSKYPEWWNTTITVYNKYEDPATHKITWHRTVVHDCFWKDTGNKIVVGETTLDTNSTLCRIPVSSEYLEKYKWDASSNKARHFTLSPGDLIIHGEIADTINEYEAGHRVSDIQAKYKKLQGCMMIEKCAINTGLGRGLEHYLVKGV